MSDRNKNRLYITLQHRGAKPGFHWALMLVPKAESPDISIKDSHVFHAINTIQPGVTTDSNGKPDWRYEDKPANNLRSGSLLARILVAKLPRSATLETQTAHIQGIVQHVSIIQNDPNWTCRVWVEEALTALGSAGGFFGTIPEVINGGTIESAIKEFGENARRTIRKGKSKIVRASDLPHTDMRLRRTTHKV